MRQAISALTLWICFVALAETAVSSEWYVATNGTAGAAGTVIAPLSLTKAISGTSPAQAGDTVWIRGGTYTGLFTVVLSAPSNSPIVIRNFNRERVILDGASPTGDTLLIEGSGAWIWGLEITNSDTNRYVVRGGGVKFNTSLSGENNKIINSIVHDVGDSIFVSYQSTNAEVFGCLIYNNGYQLSDRGHGHNLYVQNRSLTQSKLFKDNIGLNAFNIGVNCRSSFATVNMVFVGNVMANSGSTSTNGFVANFHTEGDPIVDQITFSENFSWFPSQDYGATFWGLTTNGTITVVSNVWGNSLSQILFWTNVTFSHNIQNRYVDIRTPQTNFTIADFNDYYGVVSSLPVSLDSVGKTLAQWQALGHDLNGTSTASVPAGSSIYVRPNPYESGRAHIVIYNWHTNDNVSVDLTSAMSWGSTYEIRNSEDYFAAPLKSGTYSGGSISLPMTNRSVAMPTGQLVAPVAMGVNFGTYVLTSTPAPDPDLPRVIDSPRLLGGGLKIKL